MTPISITSKNSYFSFSLPTLHFPIFFKTLKKIIKCVPFAFLFFTPSAYAEVPIRGRVTLDLVQPSLLFLESPISIPQVDPLSKYSNVSFLETANWNTHPGIQLIEMGDAGCWNSYGLQTSAECEAKVVHFKNRADSENYLQMRSACAEGQECIPKVLSKFESIAGGIDPRRKSNFLKALQYATKQILANYKTFFGQEAQEILRTFKEIHKIIKEGLPRGDDGEYRKGLMIFPWRNTIHSDEEIVDLAVQEGAILEEASRIRHMVNQKNTANLSEIIQRFSHEERTLWEKFFSLCTSPEKIENNMLAFVKKLQEINFDTLTCEDFVHLAAFVHQEIVRIHPFKDGNGRFARLLMNVILEIGGFKNIIFFDEMSYRKAVQKALKVPGNFEKYLAQMILWNYALDPLNQLPEEDREPIYRDCRIPFSISTYANNVLGANYFLSAKKDLSLARKAQWTMTPGKIYNPSGTQAVYFFDFSSLKYYFDPIDETQIPLENNDQINVGLPDGEKFTIHCDPQKMDNHFRALEYVHQNFLNKFSSHLKEKKAIKLFKKIHKLIAQGSLPADQMGVFRKNHAVYVEQKNSIEEYLDHAKKIGAKSSEIPILKQCLLKIASSSQNAAYAMFTESEKKVWNHLIGTLPPEQILEHLNQFAQILKTNMCKKDKSIKEIIGLAAWAHQEILRMRLFNEKNKEIARLLLNTIFEHYGINPVFFPNNDEYEAAIYLDRKIPGYFAVYLQKVYNWNFIYRARLFV